ncbi:uncharacterized protein LOC125138857 [Tachysurus ichikawai]
MILLNRLYQTRSFSPAEVFLLQTNFTNICLSLAYLLLFLDVVHNSQFSRTLFLFFYIPSLTARPIFLLVICAIIYLAIVHPVTYIAAKTFRHWEWLIATLGWIYPLAITVCFIIYKNDTSQLVFMSLFHITNLSIFFFNIAMLRALSSKGPGNSRQPVYPNKRKAFRVILSSLVTLLMYYVTQAYFFTYCFVAPTDWQRFHCSEGLVIRMLPMLSDLAMPVLCLCSLAKLDV